MTEHAEDGVDERALPEVTSLPSRSRC
jgi:hypothetical protein